MWRVFEVQHAVKQEERGNPLFFYLEVCAAILLTAEKCVFLLCQKSLLYWCVMRYLGRW